MAAEQIQYYSPDWVFLGDYSRYKFLRWLTGWGKAEDLKDMPVQIQYAETPSMRHEDSLWVVTSPHTIPGTTILIPLSEDSLPEIKVGPQTRFALFEEFPYGKQSSRMLLQELRRDYEHNSVLVVLMDIPIRQASTDMLPQGIELRTQYDEYQKSENVCIAKGTEDVLDVLNWEEDTERMWRRRACADLERLDGRIADAVYDYEILQLDFDETVLSEQTIDKICSLQSVKRSGQPSIWNGYAKAALLQMFPPSGSGGLYPAADLYGDILASFCPGLLEIEQDSRELIDVLKNSLVSELDAPEVSSVKLGSYTEDAYFKAVNEHKINADFRKRLEHFVNKTIFDILVQRLKLRYERIEEALS